MELIELNIIMRKRCQSRPSQAGKRGQYYISKAVKQGINRFCP
jgi:hypothetical protein